MGFHPRHHDLKPVIGLPCGDVPCQSLSATEPQFLYGSLQQFGELWNGGPQPFGILFRRIDRDTDNLCSLNQRSAIGHEAIELENAGDELVLNVDDQKFAFVPRKQFRTAGVRGSWIRHDGYDSSCRNCTRHPCLAAASASLTRPPGTIKVEDDEFREYEWRLF